MAYWAKPVIQRTQVQMFSPTLDDMIPEDHPVRLYDEILSGLDWQDWEAHYNGRRGQPPIHPRILASAILYGLRRGIRSSRQLEDACRNRLDYLWLVEGREIDHSTFAEFRTKFRKELKGLFKQVGRLAMHMGFIRLIEVATDGTQMQADSSRHDTRTAEAIEKRLDALAQEFEQALAEVDANDRRDNRLFHDESLTDLPQPLRKLQDRMDKLQQALQQVQAVEEARARSSASRAKKHPAKIPVADPESRVLPNKDGGYAPNYTPMASTDGQEGFIVDSDVVNDHAEAAVQTAGVDRIEDTFGERPETMLGDGAYGTAQNIGAMQDKHVQLLTPVQGGEPQEGSPAKRDDPSQPVPESQWDQLPIHAQSKRLDRQAFVYVESQDRYYCPAGRALDYWHDKKAARANGHVTYRVYRCADCSSCGLASLCKDANTARRTVQRDAYEAARQQIAERMSTESGKRQYRRRSWIAETPFAFIKSTMGVRRFLLRGLEKVRTEWDWICTAYNLDKLVRKLAAIRAQVVAAFV